MQALLDDEQRNRRPHVDPSRIAAGVAASVPPRFRPEARTVFRLAASWRRVPVTDGGAAPWLRRLLVRKDAALCFAHPLGGEGRSAFFGTPTASIRTLLAWHERRPERPFFLKLPVSAELGGERRDFHADDAARCVRRSALIRAFGPRGLQVMPETLALGASIVRELPARTRLVPWFALGERARPLIRPFLRAWLVSAIAHGWAPDAHAQNVLYAPGQRRFYVRDFEDVGVDLAFIAAAHPRLRPQWRALDPRAESDFPEQLETSLHGFFLGGPVWALGAAELFFHELRALTGAEVRDPRAFRDWVLERRERRLRPPTPPARLMRWLRDEQTKNPRDRDPKHFARVDLSAIPERFRPERRPVFRLPWVSVPRAQACMRGHARLPGFFAGAHVRCFFHPMMTDAHALDLAQHGPGLDVFWATPTASPRSLVVWPDGQPERAFGLKVSIDVALLGLNRLIAPGKLERAVAVSACLARSGAPHLPEPISVRLADAAWGSIGRALDADPGVPGFSVTNARAHWPALVKAFARLAFGEGLLPDLHRQNVLFRHGQAVVRDLDAFKTDLELRWRRGKTLAPFARARGTLADLKLDLGSSHYDEAWGHGLRAEWAWRGGKTAARQLDALLIAEARAWLGDAVVDDERARAGRTGFSLNAIVQAWKQRQPRPTGPAGDPAEYRRLARAGRATAPLAGRVIRDGPLRISLGPRLGFALAEESSGLFEAHRRGQA